MSYVMIVGATSDIAKSVAVEYARQGHNLYLLARDAEALEEVANDLRVRCNVDVECLPFDVLDTDLHPQVYDSAEQSIAGVICAVGYLGDQVLAQSDAGEARKIIDINYTAVAQFLDIVANDFERRGYGFIVAISSVAGDRGRKKNYYYGAAKAALSTYLSGLRNRLHERGVQVVTVKPGFVATKMTAGMDLPERLTASSEQVAADIYRAQQKGANTLYTSRIWLLIMTVIKLIPEWQFKRMDI